MLDLSIIIVNYNTKKMTLDCIRSVVNNTKGITYEIILVDNASIDGSVKLMRPLIKKYPLRVIANKKNLGFGEANNQGIKKGKGRYFLLLNTDTLIKDNLLMEMVKWMDSHPDVGIVSCALKNKNGTLQGGGGYFPTLFRVFAWMSFLEDIPGLDKIIKPFHPMHSQSPIYKGEKFFKKSSELDWVTGAFFLFRREVFEEVGFFDKAYFMYTEEVDYCFRAKKAGWKIWYLPYWSIIHFGGGSSTREFPILSEYKGIKTFYRKNMPSWQFPILRFFLKTGALLRIIILGMIKGREAAVTYVKAFSIA